MIFIRSQEKNWDSEYDNVLPGNTYLIGHGVLHVFCWGFFVAKGVSTLSNIRLCSDEKLKVTVQWALT